MKRALLSRKVLFGAWTSLAHPQIMEMFASIMKPDFLGIDIEHSTISQGESQRIIAVGQASSIPVLPRVASHNGEQIRRLLDSGANGIIVPMVNTAAEVEQIIQWCKYPPVGKRGFGVARAQGYGACFEEYTSTWNEKSVLIIQIESIQGVENIDHLLDNEHVDGVMVGPYDISGSLGIPGKLSDPKVLKASEKVIEACAKHGKACGTQITELPDETKMRKAIDNGYTFIVLASDIFLMWRWSGQMKGLINKIRMTTR
ncbi:MAG: 4-hydroxy-2-oxovalerate aldolase [Deltaproteobacteria bacterium RIFCSPLOWO2_01_44_7]|nr:MAG: 4-hydroxy-2-oxovalerate aldolase [Deltaproteobacteria bacterium RIFCSPHIGHO2_01_FULL_43_49]OGQ16123.1 MAG: 4-hydroxy-2-oxovalerate aldolase [Deltaproteobacteria bacterium RIFCSPHIGHO2_02_FULL_44_53]OGQ29084.1 MAG: 4-hydroxy-2-oxovalerate aldolase [Deltaproteobacteria bacterium RIFCSPHIGHO2_12_FULL_44_21]OGQ32640.1 MAG: 4-hydroxy-2-oxovalerate aldolase [Deltaproteobacteria bacterium RIFCSPLOWO2_01_FULL_45_74]OGQ38026.1 MAG: 4-hydroxy-2-oxovalerate aldolase [Deltaproteobacteria bacterium 